MVRDGDSIAILDTLVGVQECVQLIISALTLQPEVVGCLTLPVVALVVGLAGVSLAVSQSSSVAWQASKDLLQSILRNFSAFLALQQVCIDGFLNCSSLVSWKSISSLEASVVGLFISDSRDNWLDCGTNFSSVANLLGYDADVDVQIVAGLNRLVGIPDIPRLSVPVASVV